MIKTLLIVDVQNDFVDGALPVPHAKRVLPQIRDLVTNGGFDLIMTTGDDHPEETVHFDKWPVHCVHGTHGAQLHPDVPMGDFHIVKGRSNADDGYSAFEGVTDDLNNPLPEVLPRPENHGGSEVTVVGLALDYCVKATALDAAKAGHKVIVPLAATAPVAADTGEKAIRELLDAGVTVLNTAGGEVKA